MREPFRPVVTRVGAAACVLALALAVTSMLVPARVRAEEAPVPHPPILYPDSRLLSVSFVDRMNGWASGDNASVIRTSDGGRTWTATNASPWIMRNAPEFWVMPSIAFSDLNRGYVVRNWDQVGVTSDGGATWQMHYLEEEQRPLTCAIASVGTSDAVVIDSGSIWYSTDGGATWSRSAYYVDDAPEYKAVDYSDAEHVWIVGDSGRIVSSTDGGVSWAACDPPTTAGLNDVEFVDVSHGWATGSGGTIISTVDGGATWGAQASGVTASLRSICFVDRNRGWAVGDSGTVVSTTDGGATWDTASPGVDVDLHSVSFGDTQVGCAVGDAGTVIRTEDGGAHWSTVALNAASAAPVTSITASPAATPGGWYNQDVSIGMTATPCIPMDTLLGTYYAIDLPAGATSITWLPYAEPVTVAGEGVHVVSYFSVSAFIAFEQARTETVDIRIDRTPPIATIEVETDPGGAKVASVQATDSLSGVSQVEMRVDGGAWAAAASMPLPASTDHVVEARATDRAGNRGEARVTVDHRPKPVVTSPVTSSSQRLGHAYSVRGYLKPRHATGSHPVRLYLYRYVGGEWRSYGYVKAGVSNYSTYSKYSVAIRLRYRGRWRIRALAPADSKHVSAWSAHYDYVTVR